MNVLSNSSTGKGIKTSVKLDVKDVDRQLKKIERRITKLQTLMNQSDTTVNRLNHSLGRVDTSNRKVAKSADRIGKSYRDANSAVSVLTKNLRTLASTYLGIMGAKAVTGASDTITSAENRLNQMNGNNPQQTQQTMDKMYASAQKARMDYSAMMQNVSKSMTLAPDAFQGNIDNAIRFQEIMAEAYTLGGASAAEQHSSMYQMIQGLGSGILQGDELRSVREGAPLAYKEIEKFAQGVYNTEESLKDLASRGMITSEIVVSAMMQAGAGIDEAFAKTDMTFAQAFTNMRNVAMKSFEPVLQRLNDALNSDVGVAVINGIGTALYVVAQALLIVFNWIEKIYNFIVSNWSTIEKIISTFGLLLGIYVANQVASLVVIFNNFIVGGVVGVLKLISKITTLIKTLGWSTTMFTIFGVALNMWAWIAIAALLAIIVAVIWVADSFVDACGIVVGAVFWVLGIIHNVIAFIINLFVGFVSIFAVLLNNMTVAVNNFVQGAKVKFWEWVQDCLNGTGLIAKAVSKIAELFGLDSISIDTKINNAKGKMQEYADVSDTVSKAFQIAPYTDLKDMYNKGYGHGSDFGNGVQGWLSDKLKMDGLSEIIAPTSGVSGVFDPSKALDGIKDDTGKISDSMELTKEDLEYLLRVADMEWKKEFTTANITVDMSNYNTINGEGNLDGIVTRLADKLYEELDMVANGVYA